MEGGRMSWSQQEAIDLCRRIEEFAPLYDCHVALTGGCLYKSGPRRDVDIMFYNIRQAPDGTNQQGLLDELAKNGFKIGKRFGWVVKAIYAGKPVDLFFPEYDGATDTEYEGGAPTQEVSNVSRSESY